MEILPFAKIVGGGCQPCLQVGITYDVETGGTVEKRELPFIVGILADLSGNLAEAEKPPFRQRQVEDIDRDNFDAVLKASSPRVDLAGIPNIMPGAAMPTLCGMLGFESLADFAPSAVAARIEGLPALFEVPNLANLASEQLSLVLHAPGFQALEATWRGLFQFVTHTETGSLLKLRVLNASRGELCDDLAKAVAFDQSTLFKLIHAAEYGTYGGLPYGLLLGAYEFGPDAESIACLTRISAVAAAAHAPFIAAADPALFGLSDFAMLGRPRDLAKIFEGANLEAWHEFRSSEDSRYVSLVLPHVLMRLPYGEGGLDTGGLNFQEDTGPTVDKTLAPDRQRLLWGNGAFALAGRITRAFSQYHWPAAIRGVEGGGLVAGLPLYAHGNSTGGKELVCPTELSITDRREKELGALGFISLCHCKGTDKAAFFSSQTTNLPRQYFDEDANAAARVSAMLPCVLVASRFAHYISVIMREKIGSFTTRANVETYLNSWISRYVLLEDKASGEVTAAYPLRAASVQVTDVPGEPGSYRAEISLQPHFQMEGVTAPLRLEVRLPA